MLGCEIVCFEKLLGLRYVIGNFLGCEAVKNGVCMGVIANRSKRTCGKLCYVLPAKCERIVCAGIISDTEFLANS